MTRLVFVISMSWLDGNGWDDQAGEDERCWGKWGACEARPCHSCACLINYYWVGRRNMTSGESQHGPVPSDYL